MKLDLLLFGRIESGPFFALLERRRADRRRRMPIRLDEILYSAIDQTVPGHERADRSTCGGRRRPRGARTRGARRSSRPGRARRGRRPRALDADAAAVRIARICGGADAAPSRTLARGIRPDAIIERYHNFGGEAIRSPRAARRRRRARSERAGHRLPRARRKRSLDRALLVEPMRRWRDRLCRARRPLRHAERRDPAAADARRERLLEIEWGADTDASGPARRRRRRSCARRRRRSRLRRRVPLVARRDPSRRRASRAARARPTRTSAPCSSATDPSCRACAQAAAGVHGIVFTGALPHDRLPAALAAADIGVAPFDLGAHAPLSLGFYWSPLKIFEYMAAGLPVVAPAIARIPSLVENGREGLLYDPARRARRWPTRSSRWPMPALRSALGAAARDRARARLQLGRALPRARSRDPAARRDARVDARRCASMKILIATDAFPPVCGGSGWSTYELARGLRARGHDVTIVQPRPGTAAGVRERQLRRLPRPRFGAPAPRHSARAQLLQERAAHALARRGIWRRSSQRDASISSTAQHVMTTVPAIEAAQRPRHSRRSPRCATTGRCATGPT